MVDGDTEEARALDGVRPTLCRATEGWVILYLVQTFAIPLLTTLAGGLADQLGDLRP